MNTLWQDMRYGWRMLAKAPGFTTIAVLTLALGIGANTAVFSFIDAILLRTLPVPNPQRLVAIGWTARGGLQNVHVYMGGVGCPVGSSAIGQAGCTFPYPVFDQLQAEQRVFSGMFASNVLSRVDIRAKGQTNSARAGFVSGDFFTTLKVRPALGRTLEPSDDSPGAVPAAVLSYNYWKNHVAGDRSIVGKTIDVNNKVIFTIVGIAAPGFTGLDPGVPVELWLPLSSRAAVAVNEPYLKDAKIDTGIVWLQMMGRLEPGTSMKQAAAALNAIFVPRVTTGPNALFTRTEDPHIELASVAHGFTTLWDEYSKPLLLLLGVVGLVLLIACANIAGLLLARSETRQKEMAVRSALGASRWRIVRQLLSESVMLSLAGGSLGIVFAAWGAYLLSAFFTTNGPSWFGRVQIRVQPDLRILGFTLALSILAGILLGLMPAFRGARVDLTPALKESSQSLSGARHGWKRWFSQGNVLVVAQVALAVLALSGAGLLLRTLVNLENIPVGFETHNLLLFKLDSTLTNYKGATLAQLYRELRDRLAALPGVTSASYSWGHPLGGSYMSIPIRRMPKGGLPILAVGPDFFRTMHIPLLLGRTYTSADFESARMPQPLVINHMLARDLFGNANPLGRLIYGPNPGEKNPQWEIIGIVGNAKYGGLRAALTPVAYTMATGGGEAFELRTAANPRALIPAVRSVVNQLDSNLLVEDLKTQTEEIDESLYRERLVASLSSLFSLLALVLACIGLYGLLSYKITRRTHEIGVRMALGARPEDILRSFLWRGGALAAIGAAAGIGLAFALTRYLQSQLYGVKPIDPLTFAVVAALLCVVALLACYIPARRAMRTDPMVALRYE